MAMLGRKDRQDPLAPVRSALRWTYAGLLAERLCRAFWPLMTVILAGLGAAMLGLDGAAWGLSPGWAQMGRALIAVLTLATLWYGIQHFRVPAWDTARLRLDAALGQRPLAALQDRPAIGADDPAAQAVWQAHRARMERKAAAAKPVKGDLRLARFDPFALRFAGGLVFAVAMMFGSTGNLAPGSGLVPNATPLALAQWEGWIEPPRYTERPVLYLNDQSGDTLDVPLGSQFTLRFYGPAGALKLSETISGDEAVVRGGSAGTDGQAGTDGAAQSFVAQRSGGLDISGPGGQSWMINVLPDAAPQIAWDGAVQASALGEMRLPYQASDDYGIEAGTAEIALDLAALDRRHGLGIAPDPRPVLVVPVSLPVSGSRHDINAQMIEDLSQHPWANLPVHVQLTAIDGAGQQGHTDRRAISLPGRRFFDPLAAALAEQRRDLLWARANAGRVAQILRAVSYQPADIFRNETDGLRLCQIIARLEAHRGKPLGAASQEALAAALWDLALSLEEGDLADAAARLRRAQDRLTEAMRRGASDAEIAQLMDEMRRASQDYLRQLAQRPDQQAPSQSENGAPQNSMTMTQDDLARMMDHIQDLMEQGRMAEAEQALRELQDMMENMRVTQGQPGQGQGQNPGAQAMEGLADTLRNQQGLSDQAFRDLQEQFNPGAGAGDAEGNEGRNGGQGRGQSHEGQGQNQGQEQGAGDNAGDLARRQGALRNQLERQNDQLPGQGTAQGDAARGALDQAGRAMTRAEEALRRDDLAGAIDNQSQAMEALRDGMRALGEMLERDQADTRPGQGFQPGDQRGARRDPLGRDSGTAGRNGENAPLDLGQEARDTARALLDEIRRRSAQADRPEQERSYLRRLLDRF